MTIEPGHQLLHYRLIEKIGEGGMGLVWKAVDTDLGREVAIKVLPDAFAGDAERLTRFEREARLLASLSHPGIAAIYGLHECDSPTGSMRFLAMELVQGVDLNVRMSGGKLPVEDALDVASQICEALAAAHDAGVIHRDLKPANVMLTPEGKVKVLDFGLAKALVGDPASGSGVSASISPTMTSAGTQVGMILGTAAYMSPEQAKGKAVDRRADVWSFGCVLYECLTGRPAFAGSSVSEIIAEVLKSEPDWSALPSSTPPAVRRVLRRCLVKDPRERLRDLGDARLELADTEADDGAGVANRTPASRSTKTSALAGWIAAAAMLVLVISMWVTRNTDRAPAVAAAQPLHAEISLPEGAELGFGRAGLGIDRNMLALSPDGTQLVYVGNSPDGDSRLYWRDLDDFDPPAPIAGTEGAHHVFFSPDGGSVGFVTTDKLKRVAPNGDDLRTVAQITTVTRAQWTDDDSIYLGADQGRRLQRVSASGGEVEDLHAGWDMTFLEILPGGRSALVMLRNGISTDYADIALLDLETFQSRTILEGGYDARLVGANLIFARGGNLLAVPFDVDEGRVTGKPTTVLREVVMDAIIGQAQFTVADSGTVVFVRGPEMTRGGVARIDREGGVEFLPIEQNTFGVIDLDPTDSKLAIEVADVESHIWVYDIPTGRGTRMPGRNTRNPVWSSDGKAIAFRDYTDNTLRLESTGDAASRPAIPNEWSAGATSWSPDDRVLMIVRRAQSLSQMGFLDLEDRTVDWVDNAGDSHSMPDFSPDGKWVAYSSNETGTWETWIRSYPDGSVVRQISDSGGLEVVWSPSGEIFYRLGDRWMSIEITTEPTLSWSAPREVFATDFIDTLGRSYDVSSDGQSLYVVKQPEPPDGSRVHVITGWTP